MNGNESAMPYAIGGKTLNGEDDFSTPGLTKREYFAAKAMGGLMATLLPVRDNMLCPNFENVKYMADLAVTAADELIASLNKTAKP